MNINEQNFPCCLRLWCSGNCPTLATPLVTMGCQSYIAATSPSTNMTVHITGSKTDQFRQGDSVVIARTGSSSCLVSMLEWYMVAAELTTTSKLRLFCGIVNTKKGECLQRSETLSYTRMWELFLQKISQLGFDPGQYGLQSWGKRSIRSGQH